jgi:hypothetical protein
MLMLCEPLAPKYIVSLGSGPSLSRKMSEGGPHMLRGPSTL